MRHSIARYVLCTMATAAVLIMIVGTAAGQTCVAPPNGLVSWWPAEGTATDIQSNNNGLESNGTSYGTGFVGGAFFFDGFNDLILVNDDPSLNFGQGDDFTIDAWVNLQNPVPGFVDEIVIKQKHAPDGFSNGYVLRIANDTLLLSFQMSIDQGQSLITLDTNTPIPLNQWTHVAAVREGSLWSIYLNGVLNVSGQRTDQSVSNSWPLSIGGLYDTRFSPPVQPNNVFGGLVDEVEIFSRALTSNEILAIFTAGSAGKCTTVSVTIDIKPGSSPNCFNINDHGVIPVAIFGASDFDVGEIDTATLLFDGLEVRVRGNKGPLCSAEDSNGDGFQDIVCHFEDDSSNWTGGGATGTVTGDLLNGTPIKGTDSICIVP